MAINRPLIVAVPLAAFVATSTMGRSAMAVDAHHPGKKATAKKSKTKAPKRKPKPSKRGKQHDSGTNASRLA